MTSGAAIIGCRSSEERWRWRKRGASNASWATPAPTGCSRAFRFLLLLYPEEFRDEYGRELTLVFADRSDLGVFGESRLVHRRRRATSRIASIRRDGSTGLGRCC